LLTIILNISHYNKRQVRVFLILHTYLQLDFI